MKVYLDTNIISGLLEDQRNVIPDDQLDALEQLVDMDEVQLVTSKKLLDEVSDTQDDRRKKKLRVLFKIITKVSAPPHTRSFSGLWGDAPFGAALWGGGSGSITEKIYSALSPIFKSDDAEHIYIARKSECDFFLTLDQKSILQKYSKQKSAVDSIISPMKIVNPKSLLAEI